MDSSMERHLLALRMLCTTMWTQGAASFILRSINDIRTPHCFQWLKWQRPWYRDPQPDRGWGVGGWGVWGGERSEQQHGLMALWQQVGFQLNWTWNRWDHNTRKREHWLSTCYAHALCYHHLLHPSTNLLRRQQLFFPLLSPLGAEMRKHTLQSKWGDQARWPS